MKKRIAMALSMLIVMLMLGACGTDPTTVDYNGYSYDDLENDIYTDLSAVSQLASFYEENSFTKEELDQGVAEALIANYGFTQNQIDGGLRWLEVTEEVGEFQGLDEDSFTVAKAGNTLTTDITLNFEKRDVDFQVVYTYYSMEVSGITIEPIYSMSEKLARAGMNTIISISIVFAVLILISLIIYCFNIIPYLEKKKAEKKAAQTPEADAEVAEQEVASATTSVEQQAADDTELVAVIAAAIAASTGTSTSDFVVRSIHRR